MSNSNACGAGLREVYADKMRLQQLPSDLEAEAYPCPDRMESDTIYVDVRPRTAMPRRLRTQILRHQVASHRKVPWTRLPGPAA